MTTTGIAAASDFRTRRLQELREDIARTRSKIAQCRGQEQELRGGCGTADIRAEAAIANLVADRGLYEAALENLTKELAELERPS